ncbi:MAG: CocE/NonD family hydrolase [Aeromicrobium sp.]|uniref:CocE/NonD family hydrolase n=1 Tax=Aeromicrobium sp. TaxID=1871063 RepID=UPI0039E5BF9F
MPIRHLVAIGAATAVVALSGATGAVAAPVSADLPQAPASGWEPRPEDYPDTVTESDLSIPMSDGVELLGDLTRPVDANGDVVTEPLPVIITITAYNKVIQGSGGSPLGGGSSGFLVKRGYVQLLVDARGTGTSGGTWQVFGEREQLDAKEVVEWAAAQPWSNGSVGMSGPSYMGITQLFAAGQNPQGLKAIFPQVPSAEVYRDVVASGGQVDVGFMPMWLGLVALTGTVPPTSGEVSPEVVLQNFLEHVLGTTGTLELLLNAFSGGERAYDGPWYQERSTLLQAVPNITVPTFLVGGHYDLFQRGTPLIFQQLKEQGTPVKMLLGPWDHLQGSTGPGVPDAGYGSLSELQLRWFDRYVKDLPDPTLDSDIPDFTYYELGSGKWKQRDAYLDEQRAQVYHLSGTSSPGTPGQLVDGSEVTAGESLVAPLAAAGLCTRSATQWTAGFSNSLPVPNPCNDDNQYNDELGVIFQTEPMAQDLQILGPIGARLYSSSVTGDGLLSVHVSLVHPDGTVERLTGGWQTISMNATDEAKSVKLDGEIIQPWHPFTAESKHTLALGEIEPVDVEIFPTGAVIPAGSSLRMSVQSFDLPHLLPTLENVPAQAGAMITIYNDAEHPSRLVLPALSPVTPGTEHPETPVTGQPTEATAAATSSVGSGGGYAGTAADRLPSTGSPVGALLVLFAAVCLIGAGSASFLRRFGAVSAADLVRSRLVP